MTEEYWNNRYKNNGNSGAGSYGQLAEFKADVINNFIAENNIKTVIEFGCGDGNQLSLFKTNNYVGYDISTDVVEKLRSRFYKISHQFYHISEYDENEKADLALSLDVIYHLLEDDIYFEYMAKLFDSSTKYVIIYSCNRNDYTPTPHIRFRVFLPWILKNRKEWKLINVIENKYPFNKNNPNQTSWSDFYIFERLL